VPGGVRKTPLRKENSTIGKTTGLKTITGRKRGRQKKKNQSHEEDRRNLGGRAKWVTYWNSREKL